MSVSTNPSVGTDHVRRKSNFIERTTWTERIARSKEEFQEACRDIKGITIRKVKLPKIEDDEQRRPFMSDSVVVFLAIEQCMLAGENVRRIAICCTDLNDALYEGTYSHTELEVMRNDSGIPAWNHFLTHVIDLMLSQATLCVKWEEDFSCDVRGCDAIFKKQAQFINHLEFSHKIVNNHFNHLRPQFLSLRLTQPYSSVEEMRFTLKVRRSGYSMLTVRQWLSTNINQKSKNDQIIEDESVDEAMTPISSFSLNSNSLSSTPRVPDGLRPWADRDEWVLEK